MKKLIALLLLFASLCSIFGLTGCQLINPEGEESENTQDETNKDNHEHHKLIYEHLPDGNILYYTRTENSMDLYRAVYQETGCNPVVSFSDYYETEWENSNGETETRKMYKNVTVNECYAVGCVYYQLTQEDFAAIQEYQNRTGRQVFYPLVSFEDTSAKDMHKNDGNLYYKVRDTLSAGKVPAFDENGNVTPCYKKYNAGGEVPSTVAEYNSLRKEGEDGITEDGVIYYYVYGETVTAGAVRVRVFLWEFYQYLIENDPDSRYIYQAERHFKFDC